MGETQEDQVITKKMKKLEKQSASSNREYLDLDTDEEEFGRQETPEPEEELILEPEKPVFTEEELETLVQYIKDFSTIANLSEENWSQGVVETVKEYFRNPAYTILSIFTDSCILRALLDFPEFTDGGLTYFLRAPWQVYTPENFLSTITFGSIDGGVENSTLKFMENIYAPIAFKSNEWPVATLVSVMRNEIFSNLNEFLLCLTDATYSPMGLTILYVPREGIQDEKRLSEIEDNSTMSNFIDKTIDESQDDEKEGFIERLERVARYWIRQIREALKVPSVFTESSPCKTIVDEIRYWHYRHENLSCVYNQLTNASVLTIVKKLENVRSASVKQYNPLVGEVRRILDEAVSNITYLNLLEEFNKGFEIPDGVEDYATKILLLIRFIGRESPFYNTQEKIEKLCQACCTQVVEHCREYIDLDIVLDGDADAGRSMIVRCIDCCDKFSNIYDRLRQMDENFDSPTISLIDKSKVFNNITTFIHRCNDLIEIVEAIIVFDKCDDEIIICGPRGIELGSRYRNIEERFYATLTDIKDARGDILNIVSAVWLNRIAKFKCEIKDIENMVKNWINDIFNDVMNIEEGIEALHGIQRFSRRPYLRETLNTKWIEIWKMFDNELETCSILTNNPNSVIQYHPSLPPYSGNANLLRSNSVYLTKHYGMLIDVSDWFGDCDAQIPITRKYKSVLAAMKEKEKILFAEWRKEILEKQIDFSVVSKRSIMKYHDSKKLDTIKPNLELDYLINLREILEWNLLNYDTKNLLVKDCPKWEKLKSRYNNVEILCKFYNVIVTKITDTERFLFLTLLEDLEEIMGPGFKKITWSSDSFERFFVDCMEITMKVQKSLEAYRDTNCKINNIIKEIKTTSFVNPNNLLEDILRDSITHFEHDRDLRFRSVRRKFETISKLLMELRNSINTDEEKTAKYWNYVVERIYEELKMSLTNCVQLSLLYVLHLFRDDELIEKHPSIVETNGNCPDMNALEKAIAGINTSAIEEILAVEHFSELFDAKGGAKAIIDFIEKDSESIDLRRDIYNLFHPIASK